MSVYLYALLGAAPAQLPAAGVAGSPVRVIDCQGVVAAFSELDAPPALSVESLEAHDGVVRALAAEVDAILPARFGQVSPGRAELVERVSGRLVAWRDALEQVAGCVQMSLRLYGEALPVEAPPPPSEGARPGTRYLQARVAAERQRTRLPEAGGLLEALAPTVREQRVDRAKTPPLLASVYHLVAAPEVEAYRRRLAEHSLPAALGLSVSGPWAPYAFTPGVGA